MKVAFLTIGIFLSICIQAQNNLIRNWSFETTKSGKVLKVKAPEMIDEAMFWSSPSTPKADVFSKDSKEPLFQIPINQYGRQDIDDGSHYAGIVTYGDKEKSPKTYIQTELSEILLKDSVYCVNFFVSLSDISKVATNNIGAHFSQANLSAQALKGYQLTPHVTNKGNKVLDDQYLWTEVCGMYKALGDEKILTIGNFASDANTQILKVKKPKEFNQQQIGISYYFIDDVKVYMTDSVKGCSCKDNETKDNVKMVYKKSDSDDLESNPVKIVEYKTIYFEPKSTAIGETSTNLISMVVKALNETPDSKIIVFGSTDKEEELLMSKSKIDLSQKRCDAVIKSLVAQGIAKDRLIAKPMKDSAAKPTKNPKETKEFRKVWFEVSK